MNSTNNIMKSPLQRSKIDDSGVEAIVNCLIREHLHRRSLPSVLKLFDEETGYKGDGPSSTASLLRKFKLTTLWNRNQASPKPLSSVLELVCAFLLHRLDPHTYSVEESDVISDLIDAAADGNPQEDSLASATTTLLKKETAAPVTLFTEVMAVIPPPAPSAVLENDSLSSSIDISSNASLSDPMPASNSLEAVVPSLPSVPVPIPSSAPAPAQMSFFERLAAQKAAEAATSSTSAVSTIEISSDTQTSIPVVAPILHAQPAPPTAPPVFATITESAPAAAPMTFFERLAAQKAAASAAVTTSVTSSTISEKADPQASLSTTPTIPAPIPDARAGMSFAERIAAQKSASASTQSLSSSTTDVSAVAPSPTPASTAITPVANSNTASASFAYTAPDGKGFATRDEYRKYMFTTFYSYSSRTGETLLKAPGTLDGQPFSMDDMRDCTIMLCDHSETVQVDRVTNCKILIAACCESVFLRNCTDCVIYVACKQLRTRDCVNCRVFLYSKTDPIIEASHTMLLAPFMASYHGLSNHMKSARLEPQYNHWKRIFDFSADDTKMPRPHWSIMDESEWGEEWIIEGIPGTPENPVPRDAAPKDDSALPEGFDIKKGPAAAESILQRTAPVVVKPQSGSSSTSAPLGPTVPSAPAPPSGGSSFFARLAAKNREQN